MILLITAGVPVKMPAMLSKQQLLGVGKVHWGNIAQEHKRNIDLHGYTAFDAEEELILLLDSLPKHVQMVEVTHGYHRGTTLKKWLRNDFYHWRVARTQAALNAGITYLVLK